MKKIQVINSVIFFQCKKAYRNNNQMMLNARKGLLCYLRTPQAPISLRFCTGWSGPSLPAYRINGYLSICRRTENANIRLRMLVWTFRCSHMAKALRKHAYSNILKSLQPKRGKFSDKNSDIFHISAQNIDCGYSLEPPRRGGSNEYP